MDKINRRDAFKISAAAILGAPMIANAATAASGGITYENLLAMKKKLDEQRPVVEYYDGSQWRNIDDCNTAAINSLRGNG